MFVSTVVECVVCGKHVDVRETCEDSICNYCLEETDE